MWQWPTLESIWADVRFALRQLRRSPGFTIAAVLTLALAIGANAVVFGVLNGLILRPLNVPQAKSLYTIEHGGEKTTGQSYPDYLDLRDRNRSFDGLAAFTLGQAGLDTGKDPSSVWATKLLETTSTCWAFSRFSAASSTLADEHGPNSAPYIVLSYAYWHSRFQDDRGVVGHVVQINKHPFTILGVAPPEFQGTLLFFSPDFWTPIVNRGQVDGMNDLNARGKPQLLDGVGASESGSHSGTGCGGFELYRLIPGEDLSQGRRQYGLYTGASGPARRLSGPSGTGISDRTDVAGRADSAGRMRQPGQLVCRARRRPFPRSCSAARAGIDPQTHSAAGLYRSRADFSDRGRCWDSLAAWRFCAS